MGFQSPRDFQGDVVAVFNSEQPLPLIFFADWACAKIEKAMAAIIMKPQMALIGILGVPLTGPPAVHETSNSEPLQA
jgi:hypothetical protein